MGIYSLFFPVSLRCPSTQLSRTTTHTTYVFRLPTTKFVKVCVCVCVFSLVAVWGKRFDFVDNERLVTVSRFFRNNLRVLRYNFDSSKYKSYSLTLETFSESILVVKIDTLFLEEPFPPLSLRFSCRPHMKVAIELPFILFVFEAPLPSSLFPGLMIKFSLFHASDEWLATPTSDRDFRPFILFRVVLSCSYVAFLVLLPRYQ